MPERIFASSQCEAAHCAGSGSELIGLQTHPLQHRDKEIWQRIIMLGIEGEVLDHRTSAQPGGSFSNSSGTSKS